MKTFPVLLSLPVPTQLTHQLKLKARYRECLKKGSYPVCEECLDLSSMQVLFVSQPGDGVPAKGHAGRPFGVPGMDGLHGLQVLLVGRVVAGCMGHQRVRGLLDWRLGG